MGGVDSASRGDANDLERHKIALIHMPFFSVGIRLDRLTDANPAKFLARFA